MTQFHKDAPIGDIHIIHQFVASSVSGMNALPVVASDIGKVCRRTDSDQFFVLQDNTGPLWRELTSLGGGAGGGFRWQEGAGNPAPEQALEYEHIVRKFTKDDATAQSLYGVLRVPSTYTAGGQVKMKIGCYTPSAANTWHMKAKATLIRSGTDAVNSTTNQYTSTNSAVTADIANKLVVVELDLSSGVGEINSVAISAGDLIGIELFRNSGTTDTADTRVLEDFSEFSFS